MGKAIKKVAAPAAGFAAGGLTGGAIGSLFGGGSIAGKAKDLLFGKVQGGIQASPIAGDIFATQKEALGLQRSGLKDIKELTKKGAGKQIAKQQIDRQKKFAIGAAQDARRRLQEMAARRGLSRSSIPGMQQNLIQRQLGEQVAGIESRLPALQRAQEMANVQARLGAGRGVVTSQNINAPLTSIAGQRRGGLSGVLGGGIGALLGGPAGASVGMGIGKAFGSSGIAG